ncbi:hypothetical protein A6A04_00245 [Paramagnetospirillum marisnigri]|uniref:Uncharacterized protein n=1 Tax=Paramagnetospirillum marisnigri TaxID=1285242 RepID=A0A178MTT8_9PROT|nr:hypothetical protein [Paramagnetospirillum marisnigri]OAN52174.1 hypothetical protein A6A04_00245 [Paramagnetospirillum marisnigri]
MMGSRSFKGLSVAVLACATLAACGGEPSDGDMKAAVEETYKSLNKDLGSVGSLIGKDLSTKIKALRKISCAKADGTPGYRCDFEMTVDGPLGEKTEKASGRFVKGDKAWTVLEK